LLISPSRNCDRFFRTQDFVKTAIEDAGPPPPLAILWAVPLFSSHVASIGELPAAISRRRSESVDLPLPLCP
jgi:hypothetical protein